MSQYLYLSEILKRAAGKTLGSYGETLLVSLLVAVAYWCIAKHRQGGFRAIGKAVKSLPANWRRPAITWRMAVVVFSIVFIVNVFRSAYDRDAEMQKQSAVQAVERARITVEVFDPGLLSSDSLPTTITYEIQNTGLTKANIIRTEIKRSVGTNAPEMPDYGNAMRGLDGPLEPRHREREAFNMKELVGSDELDRLRAAKEVFFFWGRITYETFGKTHTTGFGYRFDLTINQKRRIPGYNYSN